VSIIVDTHPVKESATELGSHHELLVYCRLHRGGAHTRVRQRRADRLGDQIGDGDSIGAASRVERRQLLADDRTQARDVYL